MTVNQPKVRRWAAPRLGYPTGEPAKPTSPIFGEAAVPNQAETDEAGPIVSDGGGG